MVMQCEADRLNNFLQLTYGPACKPTNLSGGAEQAL
jgi:hypothetical protein